MWLLSWPTVRFFPENRIGDNVVWRNGFQPPFQGDVRGAGIFIGRSRDVRVYGNIMDDNAAAITAVQEPAGDEGGRTPRPSISTSMTIR